jgi:phage terminase large subunit-like protein
VICKKDPLAALLALAPSPALKALHEKQKAAIAGSKRFRCWMAGRRAGKSFAAAVWLLGGKRGEKSAYLSRTLKSAKSIMLGVFAELNATYGLGLEIRIATGTVREPSGHTIQFYGLRDQSQADLIRGQKFRRVFVDEGGAFPDDLLKYSIESVIQPALIDLQGSLIVAGTPGPIPRGYFYSMTGNPGLDEPMIGRWPVSYWTFKDNPHVPREAVLEEALTVNGWTADSPTFRREYLGIWCEDLDALIYRYRGDKWAALPGPGKTVLALDFGSGEKGCDSTTWTVWRQPYNERPHLYCLEAIARDDIELPEVAQITRDLREKWSVNKIVADEGALGKSIARSLRSQYKLPIEAAKKQDKRGRILSMRGRLDSGTVHLCPLAAPLAEEWQALCWNDTRSDHHPRQVDDLSDSGLYGTEEFVAWEDEPAPTVIELEHARARSLAQAKASRGPGFRI